MRRNGLGAGVVEHGLGALGVGPGLVPDGLEAVDAVLERRIVDVGHSCFDGVVEAFEAQFRFGGALVELRDVLVIVTRNTKHFLPFDIAVWSPDEAAAEGDRA